MSKFPEWYLFLRPELRPTGERINRLEALRAKYEIPPELFAYSLSSQPGAGRILQINLYKQARERWPNMSEKELLKSVFIGRALKPEPYGYGMTLEEFEKVMEKINSLEELCDYVALESLEEPEFELDTSKWERDINTLKKAGIGKEIDWERHKRNVERIKKDNVKEKIRVIMEEEAEIAMAKVKDEMRDTENSPAKIMHEKSSLTEKQIDMLCYFLCNFSMSLILLLLKAYNEKDSDRPSYIEQYKEIVGHPITEWSLERKQELEQLGKSIGIHKMQKIIEETLYFLIFHIANWCRPYISEKECVRLLDRFYEVAFTEWLPISPDRDSYNKYTEIHNPLQFFIVKLTAILDEDASIWIKMTIPVAELMRDIKSVVDKFFNTNLD